MVSTDHRAIMAITQRPRSYIQEILDIAEPNQLGSRDFGSTQHFTCEFVKSPAWSVRLDQCKTDYNDYVAGSIGELNTGTKMANTIQ